MATITNISNSFVTWYNFATESGRSEYVTDTICGIQKDFCLPIYDVYDLSFQVQVTTNVDLLDPANLPPIYRNDPVPPPFVVPLTGVIAKVNLVGTNTYNIWFTFFASNLLDGLFDGDCFTLSIVFDDSSNFVSNQCFKKIADKCLTTRVTYFNNENAFGFDYRVAVIQINPPPAPPLILPTINAVRLPFYLKEPIISSDKNVYVRSDGSRKLLSARLSKKYKALVDHVPEEVHQNLVVALNHDVVTFYPDNITNGIRVRFEDEYNNNFPEVMQNVSIWSADFTIFETPFNNFNSNCS